MSHLINCSLLAFISEIMQLYLILILFASPCVKGHDGEFDALNFLELTGYLDDLDGVSNRYHAPDNVKQAIKEYQALASLPVSGRLDQPTVEMMKTPRCGVPDVIKPSLRPPRRLNDTSDIDAPLAYQYHNNPTKWHKNHLTWKFTKYTRKFTEEKQRKIIAQALKMWSDVTPLTFQMSTGEVDMQFSFGGRVHGFDTVNDKRCSLDGRGGIIAHAFQPGFEPHSGDVHFDDDERWTTVTDERDYVNGFNLLQIALHEIGHALGLGHSSNKDAIMYWYNTGDIIGQPLHYDDITGIQSIYGARPGTMPLPTLPPTTTERPIGQFCDLKFDAVEQVHNGDIYYFVGQSVYRMTQRGPVYQGTLNSVFQGAPSSPGAVVYDKNKLKLFFFKGTQFWRYTGWYLDQGYPKTLPRDFHNIEAAMEKKGRIYVFQEKNVAYWSEDMTSYSRGAPFAIEDFWGIKRTRVDAAFHASNGNSYIFGRRQIGLDQEHNYEFVYYKFAIIDGYLQLVPDSPKYIRTFWLSCKKSTDEDDDEGGDLFGYPGK